MKTVVENEASGPDLASPVRPGGYRRVFRLMAGATNLYIFLVLLALMALFSLISPNHSFWGVTNFKNIAWDSWRRSSWPSARRS